MGKTFSNDTVLKCFALVFDGLSAQKVSDKMQDFPEVDNRYPSRKTVESWAKRGELTNGINWYAMRDLTHNVRAKNRVDTELIRRKPKEYETWLEDTYSDVDRLQDVLMENLQMLRFSPSDLTTLAKTRAALDDLSGQRYEQSASITRSLGKIVKAAFQAAISMYPASDEANHALSFAAQALQEEFTRYLTEGSPNEFDPKIDRPTTRRVSVGN